MTARTPSWQPADQPRRIREGISKRHQRKLILHADNGGAMRSATLEVRLEELGVLRCSLARG